MHIFKKTFLFLSLLAGLIYWSITLGQESVTLTDSGAQIESSVLLKKAIHIPPPQSGSADFFLALKKPVRLNLFYDDASLFRFVSKDRPLDSRMYRPEDLTSISWAHINEAGRIGYLRTDAKTSLLELAEAFEQEFGESLVVISGYRSAAYQQRLWSLGKCHDTLCAPPGYSEHQLGLAVDLFDASTEWDFFSNKRYKKYVAWMQKNAHFYGWHQSYQNGAAIDGYEVEPWHWRYLGKEMATRLKRLGWTFTEYVRFQEAIQDH